MKENAAISYKDLRNTPMRTFRFLLDTPACTFLFSILKANLEVKMFMRILSECILKWIYSNY